MQKFSYLFIFTINKTRLNGCKAGLAITIFQGAERAESKSIKAPNKIIIEA